MKSAPSFHRASALWLDPLLLTGLGFLYLTTLYPLLWWGDEPELLSAAWMNGVAHPTGYPLYLLLVKAFCHLPLGSIAWRGHFFSMCAALVGIGFLFQIVPVAAGRMWKTIGWRIGILFLALAPLFWEQTGVAEVYTLSFAFFAAVLWMGKEYERKPSLARFVCLSIGAGLGFGHHRLLGLMLPGLALWLVRPLRRDPRWGVQLLAGAAAFAVSTTLPYLVLYIRAQGTPPLNWEDPSTLANLWNVFSASQFRVDQVLIRVGGWSPLASLISIPLLLWENLGLALLLAPVGAALLYRNDQRLFWAGLAAWGLPTVFVAQYLVADQATFHLLPSFVVALAVAGGWGGLFEWMGEKNRVGLVGVCCVALALLGNRYLGYEAPPESVAELPLRYARRVLDHIPANSVLIAVPPQEAAAVDFVYFPFLYEHHVARRNEAAAVISESYFSCPWYRKTLEQEGLSTVLFDHLEHGSDKISIQEIDPRVLRKEGLAPYINRRPESGKESIVFRLRGRTYFQDPRTLGMLLAQDLMPAIIDRPIYATRQFRIMEPFMKEKIRWQLALHVPMAHGGFGPLDNLPVPTGRLFRAEILPPEE